MRSAGLAVVLLALAGCGGGSHPDEVSSDAARAPARTAARNCDEPGLREHEIRLRTSDGVTLAGAVAGSGPVGAVLIHEYPRDLCGSWPYARYLAHHGVQALAIDLRCFGRSACPSGRGHATTDVAAAVAELRRRGARRVAFVGASMGGAVAVVAAASLHPAAVVDLSGERSTTGLTPGIDADAGAAAPRVTAPSLFAVAREDRYVSVADMRAVARPVRSSSKRVIVLPPEAGHGWDMLFGTTRQWSPLAATAAAFIRRHARSLPRPLQKCRSVGPGWSALDAKGDFAPYAAHAGRGSVGVVFANDSNNDACSWTGLARALVARGHAVAVFDGPSAGFEAQQSLLVARALRRTGVRRIVVIGASVGARAALQLGAEHPRAAAGLVALSAERRVGAGAGDLLAIARRIRVPVLSIGSREDPLTSFGKDTPAWGRAIAHARTLMLPGSDHGVDFLHDRHRRRVQAAIVSFVDAR